MTADTADGQAAETLTKGGFRRRITQAFLKRPQELLSARRLLMRDGRGSVAPDDEVELIKHSNLFDATWYKEHYHIKIDPVRHYVEEGFHKGLRPHPLFDVFFYLGHIDGMGELATTPLGHYVVTAGRMQSTPTPLFDSEWYAAQYPAAAQRDEIAFRDYLLRGALEGLRPHPLFDVDWYYSQEPGLAQAGINPLTHFVEIGATHGINPNSLFDVHWYRNKNASAVGDQNPLAHFVIEGHKQNFSPSPLVDLDLYRRKFPNVPEDNLAAFSLLVNRDANVYLAGKESRRKGSAVQRRGSLVIDPALVTATPPLGGQAISTDKPINLMLASVARGRRIVELGYVPTETVNRAAIARASGATSFRVMARDLPARSAHELNRISVLYTSNRNDDASRHAKLFSTGDGVGQVRWQPYWCETDGSDAVINATIAERDIKNKIGDADVILSLWGLFHERNPLGLLRRLSFLMTEYVLFYTTIIEPFEWVIGAERVIFTENDMWPAQGLTTGQMLAIDAYLRERDISLTQFEKAKSGLPWDLAIKDGGWFWFFGEGAILWLADRAGLEVVDAAIEWDGRARIYMARRKRK